MDEMVRKQAQMVFVSSPSPQVVLEGSPLRKRLAAKAGGASQNLCVREGGMEQSTVLLHSIELSHILSKFNPGRWRSLVGCLHPRGSCGYTRKTHVSWFSLKMTSGCLIVCTFLITMRIQIPNVCHASASSWWASCRNTSYQREMVPPALSFAASRRPSAL